MPHYDLIVIGSGPAGEKAAEQAAYFGKRVAMIESQPRLGGACINTGTLPSKTLRESALYLSGLTQRGLYGVDYQLEGGITVERLMYRAARVQEKQLDLLARKLERHGIDLIHGRASFEAPNTLSVRKPGGSSIVLTGDYLVIATGSYPHRPDHIPFDDKTVYDSDSILGLDCIPGSLTVVGAGVIGCEYACIFAALGVEVVLIDARERILPFIDDEISDTLTRRMKRLGIELLLEEETVAYEIIDGHVKTALRSGKAVETEKLLFSSGRNGSTRDLGLETIGIQADRRGYIPVNEHYQTTVPHLYAAGDVVGFPSLASTSMEQGRIAACHAFSMGYQSQLTPILPYGLYTIPEVSMAGQTEEDLREKGIPYEAGRASYENNARGQITGDVEGILKLLFDPGSGKLLGVHIIGENATELIHVGALCMYYGGSIDSFIHSVFNFPTLAETYKSAAYDGLARVAKSQTPTEIGKMVATPVH